MDLFTKLKKYKEFSMGLSEEVCELIYEDTSFDDIVFTGYDLNNSNFLEVKFNSCDFSKVYLSGATLCGSVFDKCKFSENTFRKGNADYSIFNSTEINRFDLFRTTFYESQFNNVNVFDSKYELTYLDDSHFLEVVFKNTQFKSASFNDSTFKNVKFINCYFEKTTFQNITGFSETQFINSTIVINGESKSGLSNHEMKTLLQ